MKDLVQNKEKQIMLRLHCKFDLCPVLDKMGGCNKNKKNPNITLIEIRPRKRNEAEKNDQGMDDNAVDMFKFQGIDFIELEKKISDEMSQD